MSAMSSWFKAAVVAAALVVQVSAAQAVTYTVSFSGVFNANVPTTTFSLPNAAWAVSFDIDSNPVPLPDVPGVLAGAYTTVPFSNFKYTLNGAPAAPALFLGLYHFDNDGGLSLFFEDVFASNGNVYEALELWGPQIYSGPEASPTILTGSFPTFRVGFADSVTLASGGVVYHQGHTVITIVPEPGTGLMLAAGALTLGLFVRRRAAAAA